MCGIAGCLRGKPFGVQELKGMLDRMVHRGPDSEGVYQSSDKTYCAGMRRLSINDLATGDQPLFNEDRSVALVYNGEIYNCRSLQQELEARGHRFATSSDGEVICHLYEEYGERAVERLDGMFAMALWDENNRRLILARDIPGEKPLYYSKLPGGEVVFASEIKSLLAFPRLECEWDYQALWDFPTFLWIPEPSTAFKQIKALLPGHLLVAGSHGIRIRAYANRFGPDSVGDSEEEMIETIQQVVGEAVSSRLLSDVPVGCFLSGGLDSSIVTGIAKQGLPELSTFTVGFEDLSDPYHGQADESAQAEDFAKLLGTHHHTIRVTDRDFLQSLDDFCAFGDLPFGVSSGLGILAVARAAREAGVKVLLSGDGADECFGGYSWYTALNNSLPSKPPVAGCVSFQNVGMPSEQRIAAINSYPESKRAWAWHYYAAEEEKARLFNDEPFETVVPSTKWFDSFKNGEPWSPIDFISHDRGFYFPNEMLRKIDRMTMAHSVEGRAPFAAPSVLKLSSLLRYEDMIRGGTLKWSLRRAFADLLPTTVVERPKHGFNVPIDHWLQGSWSHLVDEAFCEGSAMRRLGLTHSGSADVARELLRDPMRLSGHTVFCYVMLNKWLEQTIVQ